MAYYLKQYKAQNGVEKPRFYTFDRSLISSFASCAIAKFESFNEAQYHLAFAKRKFGGWWEIRKKDGTNDHCVVRMEAEPTLHEIERDVMMGKHVSPHNLNRLMRSPRGQMMMSALHR